MIFYNKSHYIINLLYLDKYFKIYIINRNKYNLSFDKMGNGLQNSLVQHERTSLNTKDCLTDQDCYD